MALFSRKTKGEPDVVDLRETAPAKPKFEFGFPTLCPECAAPGYLDSIDMIDHVMHQHCPSCWHRWSTTEAELAAQQ